MKRVVFAIAGLILLSGAQTQSNDPGVMKEGKPWYKQNTIMMDIRTLEESTEPAKKEKRFQADLSGMNFPNKEAVKDLLQKCGKEGKLNRARLRSVYDSSMKFDI